MIRLEKTDFEDLVGLANRAAANDMTSDQFRKRFGYLVGLK